MSLQTVVNGQMPVQLPPSHWSCSLDMARSVVLGTSSTLRLPFHDAVTSQSPEGTLSLRVVASAQQRSHSNSNRSIYNPKPLSRTPLVSSRSQGQPMAAVEAQEGRPEGVMKGEGLSPTAETLQPKP